MEITFESQVCGRELAVVSVYQRLDVGISIVARLFCEYSKHLSKSEILP